MATDPLTWPASKPTRAVIDWLLETRYPGVMPVEIDADEGQPSRWMTLRAMRVLDWYSARS